MWPFSSKKRSLEEQLAVFASCGISLNDGITIDDLLSSFSREQYEKDTSLLAVRLGGEVEKPPYAKISNQLWHFDTECIEDHGDYVRIAEHMRDLAAPHLPFTEISDHVDVEEGRAELAFTLQGQSISWNLAVNNDWVDTTIFGKFVDLLKKQTTSLRYTYLDLKGQDCLIGCGTDEQRIKLNKATGLNFVWLN